MQLFFLLSHLLLSSYATEKVVVIDTGIDLNDNRFHHLCPTGHRDFTDTGMTDRHGHGTHIVGIIDKDLSKDYCIVVLKYFDLKTTHSYIEPFIKALQYAVSLHPKVVNLSMAGPVYNEKEHSILKEASDISFMAAAGNEHMELNEVTGIYPAQHGLSNITVIGALDNGVRASYSNYGKIVTQWEEGQVVSLAPNGTNVSLRGTSQATAVYTSKFLARHNGR